MSRRGAGNGQTVAGLLLACAIGGGLWYAWQNHATPRAGSPATTPAVPAQKSVADQAEPVSIDAVVRGASDLRDDPLGISAPAGPLALVRTVEVWQWQEHCVEGRCRHQTVWSQELIDSSAFRERKGHENTGRLPFRSETFAARDMRAGNLRLDSALIAQLPLREAQATALPVRVEQLPPNLAATFRERDGVLYAGDPDRPAIGDLRVRYATLSLDGKRRFVGVRDGERLKPAPR